MKKIILLFALVGAMSSAMALADDSCNGVPPQPRDCSLALGQYGWAQSCACDCGFIYNYQTGNCESITDHTP